MGGYIHFDRIADEVRIFLNDRFQAILFQKLIVLVVLGVRFDVQNNLGSDGRLLRLVNGVTVRTGRFPLISFLAAQSAAENGNLVRHHKGGIEADTELPDNVVAVLRFILVLKSQRSALGDDPQVILQFFLRHPDPGIGDGQRAVVLIHRQLDVIIVFIER
ncbi:hypothetical protein D1872_248090 [compost metagenome]